MKRERIEPEQGQESVWDYPRPPRLEASDSLIQVVAGGQAVAESRSSLRMLETSHPPVYYIPPRDVHVGFLAPSQHASFCEWKGKARYFDLVLPDLRIENAAWCYPSPPAPYAALTNYLAFYVSKMDVCFIDGERVMPQAGDFYGGWVTSRIVGPFKGGPGTFGW